VKSIRNEKRNHDHVRCLRQFPPIRDQRRLFHVSIQDGRILSERADFFRFAFCRHRAVFIQIRPVRNDQQTSLAGIDITRDLASALEEQIGHHWMIPYRLTILPDLTVGSLSDPAGQFKLARNHRLCEITFANKIRNNVNLANQFGIEQEQCIAQTRFLFPESAADLVKNFPAPNLRRVRQCRRAGIRTHGRAMTDNK